ncbi:MAG: hypothetical protein NTY81_02535 [Candidatus Staskawiczbacteria bacterium]|nr:hypothetical protein [Candidatus Staskawiczbacteria bacterium]
MNILEILTPSKKKIIFAIILLISTIITIFWYLSFVMDCMFSWGCNGSSGSVLFIIILVGPVYFFLSMFAPILKHFNFLQEGNVWIFVFGFFEIIYLYILSCIIIFCWSKIREQYKE